MALKDTTLSFYKCIYDERSHSPIPISEHPALSPKRVDPMKEMEQTFPHQAQSDHVTARWARATRSLAPVRGLTRPSIPLPFHWCAETSSQTFSPRVMDFFFLNTHSGPGLCPHRPSLKHLGTSTSVTIPTVTRHLP
jgi:hypothetical protein